MRDTIYREEAITKIAEHLGIPAENWMKIAEEWLRDVPSAQPERMRGQWISHGEHCRNLGVMPSGLGAYEWCSNCDCGIDVREWYRNRYNYCPNCGADMRGGEDGTT